MAMRVQRARLQRDERDKQKIGKGDPRQRDGEREFLRIRAEAWRQNVDEIGGKGEGERDDKNLGGEQAQKNLAGKQPRAGKTFGLKHARVARDIGGIESTLAENGSKMVGQAMGHEESVGEQTRAEDRAKQDIARKPGAAREQGQAADGNQTFVHGCYLSKAKESSATGEPIPTRSSIR